jgi:ABC-type Fe3+ transport system substrate-binding protein
LAGVVASAVIGGCGNKLTGESPGTSTTGTGGGNQLVVISPHSEDIQFEFERLFKAKHPGTIIKWMDQGGSANDLNFVLQQFGTKEDKGQGIGVDVFFGGGPETYQELDTAGLLEPLKSDYKIPAALNGVPLRSKTNKWVAGALSSFGILYNKELATRDKLPVPGTWADLGNPALRDRIVLADPRKSGSAHAAYEIILQTYGWRKGWEILTAMTGNASRFRDSASELPRDVSNGEAVMVPAIDFFARTAVERAGGKLAYIEPLNQRVVTPDPIGILRGAANAKLANDFVDVVMSPEGQKLWMLKQQTAGGPTKNNLYRQAALPSLYKPLPPNSIITENPYAGKNAHPFDSNRAAVRRIALDQLIGAVLIDNHKLIQQKWAANPNAAQVAFVPVGEMELLQLAVNWGDATQSQKNISAWREAARKHFQ